MKSIIFEDENEFAQIGETERLVVESIKRIVMTSQGERPNNLDFGFGIRNYLFYSTDTLKQEFKDALKVVIEREEPRILVKEILMRRTDVNKVQFRFSYIIREFYLDEHTLDLEIGV